ncbi:hypothetical protein PR002_g16862 [Phytophthora rubi]|uniref:Uncharacterized protein n=1 Tax=Phytophthora rubi TaxID=129364 RepID=A0A6A3KCT2_9STRA|nr:hypothetical protein PR002_g16862 [Phytophthora rubi]
MGPATSIWQTPAASSSGLLRLRGAGALLTLASAHALHTGGGCPGTSATPSTALLEARRRQASTLRWPSFRWSSESGSARAWRVTKAVATDCWNCDSGGGTS